MMSESEEWDWFPRGFLDGEQSDFGAYQIIREGHRVTIADAGGERTGTAIRKQPDGWVLQMPDGSNELATWKNVERVAWRRRPPRTEGR